jgi:pimeloyl-ACP methyl ester carboxylesterase
MPQVEANGVTIEYDSRGEGEPILFIMGLGGQLIDWPEDFVDPFVDEGYRVIRFDNRDIGLSTQLDWTPPGNTKTLGAMVSRRPLKGVGYTMIDMAADAAGLLDALGIASAHVVGASMGGMIAQEMAIGDPAKVRSMCSIMSNSGDRRNGTISKRLIPRLLRHQRPTRETAIESAVGLFELISGPHFDADETRKFVEAAVERSFTPEGAARQAAAIAGSRDRSALLGSITAPTLTLHGLVDPLVKPSGGVATALATPGARFLGFPDMGHDLPRPRWPEVQQAIIENCRRAA